MIEISLGMARYLFNSKEEVYICYPDGSESLIHDINEIINLNSDCILARWI